MHIMPLQLTDYIKQNIAAGYSEETIRASLLGQNIEQSLIDEAYAKLRGHSASAAPTPIQPAFVPANTQANTPLQPTMNTQPANDGPFDRRIDRIGFFLGFVYWFGSFTVLIILFMIGMASGVAQTVPALYTLINIFIFVIGAAVIIAMLPVMVSLYVRRLHDLGHPWIFILFHLIPVVGPLGLYCYLQFAPGTTGENRYGKPTKSYDFFVVLGFKRPNQHTTPIDGSAYRSPTL